MIKYGRGTYGEIELLDNFPKLVEDIEVGNFCSIARDVSAVISGHNHKWITTFPFPYRKTFKARDIKGLPVVYKLNIGSDVWIGRKTLFVGNVDIGHGCIIGGGSVVRGMFEPYSIIIGNPAICIRKRFSDDQIKDLLEIKWWNWTNEKIANNSHLLCSDNLDDFIRKHKVIK
jgi:acetyltransferase-like isoleucine patch superfamily enzyme